MANKERVLDVLYSLCQTRTFTTKQVVEKMIHELNESVSDSRKEELIEIIRPYKNSLRNLEDTVNKVCDKLSSPSWNSYFGAAPQNVQDSVYPMKVIIFDAGLFYCPYVPLQMVRAVDTEEELDF